MPTKRTDQRRAYPTIQAWMDATGTNQRELARAVGMREQHLSNVLRHSRRCSLYLALKLAKHCNVPVEAIKEWPAKYGESAL